MPSALAPGPFFVIIASPPVDSRAITFGTSELIVKLKAVLRQFLTGN
jgi:hypothetical protein